MWRNDTKFSTFFFPDTSRNRVIRYDHILLVPLIRQNLKNHVNHTGVNHSTALRSKYHLCKYHLLLVLPFYNIFQSKGIYTHVNGAQTFDRAANWCVCADRFPHVHSHTQQWAVQYRISIRNSSWTQISQNLVRQWHLFHLSNRLEILHRAQQCHCRDLCKITKRLGNCKMSDWQTRLHEIWV